MQWYLVLDLVTVPPALPVLDQVARVDQISDGRTDRAFGHVEVLGDVAQACVRVPGDEEQRPAMVRQERPRAHTYDGNTIPEKRLL
ncbi:MAG: hypothetical protein WEB03_03630 [Nitriliruptor sp.]